MGAVSADQSNIYVNGLSGNDAYDGESPVLTGGNNGPKQTIGNAVDTVMDSGTVNIADGTYTGALNVGITVSKSISLIGADTSTTIIDVTGQK